MDNKPPPSVPELLAAAVQYHRAGRAPEAVHLCKQALALEPSNAVGLHLLGVLALQQRFYDAAIDLIGKAVAQNPNESSFHSNLGAALQACGRLDEAAAAFQRAVDLDPNMADGYYNLGNALQSLGRPDDAVAAYSRAITAKPDHVAALSNLGLALWAQGKIEEAVESCRRGIACQPDYAIAHCNLGMILRAQGKLDEAARSLEAAIALSPNYADAQNSLGNVLVDQGRVEEAIATYRRALAVAPTHVAMRDALLFALNYASGVTPGEIAAEHRLYGALYAGGALPAEGFQARDRARDRRLRIGYVSPDFRSHSVAWFLEPVLRAHDRHAVEVFCYSEVPRPDMVTARLRQLAGHWRSTVGLSDDAVAAQIRADEIDILVDLAGHTAGNRLPVFARKPAPLQVTWLGYPATSGLSAMDYRIVDAVTDPPGSEGQGSETLIRLDGGFLCYAPPPDLGPAGPPPCHGGAPITFGSFNNPAKLSRATLDCWGTLLQRLPHSRLVLKGGTFHDAATRELYIGRFVERGVAPQRLELVGWLDSPAEHLALYDRVDIALDPFPYNGTTTTCEALWMGVPVVALRGDRHAGRVGASLLGQVGLAELVADGTDAYLSVATELAGNPQRLAALRMGLRDRMRASPLCDAEGFTRKLETAYRDMWCRFAERT